MKKLIGIIWVLLLSLASCIKEARTECPCFLSLDFSMVDTSLIRNLHIWFVDSQNDIISYDVLSKECYDDFYEIAVPKGYTNIFCWGNVIDSDIDEVHPALKTAPGNSSDKLYFYKARISSTEEFAHDTVKLEREYIGINVKISGDVYSTSGFGIKAKSNSIGYYISGNVFEGLFEYAPEPDNIPVEEAWFYEYSIEIPRQKDLDKLRLILLTNQNGFEIELLDFPLGKAISEMGIGVKSMEDVQITIDYSLLTVKINIEGWEATREIEINI